MPEIVTTLTGYETKPGSDYVLTKFTAEDGKKYQTFDEDVAAAARGLVGQPARITFEVQSRTHNGRTFTNNVIQAISDAAGAAPATTASAGGNGSGKLTPGQRLTAFNSALALASAIDANLKFDGYVRLADMVVAYAEGTLAGVDPEDATPEATVTEEVPD